MSNFDEKKILERLDNLERSIAGLNKVVSHIQSRLNAKEEMAKALHPHYQKDETRARPN